MSIQQNHFDEKIKQKASEANYTQAFTKEDLQWCTEGLTGWDELSGKQRNERALAGGPNKKLYKLSKRFNVVHFNGVEGQEAVLVEREKDGSKTVDSPACVV